MQQPPIPQTAPSPQGQALAMPVTTTFEFPGWEVQRSLGACFGLIVRSMGFAKGFGAAWKTLKGGEVSQYTELLEDSRRHAMDRMIENARLLGANAIVGMRFDSSEIGESLTEIVAYCTAVVVGARQ
ncbi:MAG: YbjQ family protein [Actinomycetota bacterium]|nr:YbjQ family protein [Actinomycetota bacterium]